ncbi:MAG: endonuclease/exonuclease/phosphatase family protein [Eubacteriales bacterium]|nr:endonuclease/exonuclease/phosphatase family protein [Eubacteriales bacterium]
MKAKKIFSLILCLTVIVTAFSGCKKVESYAFDGVRSDENSVSAVTFNCAAPWGNALKGTSSSARVKRFAQYMSDVKPDLIGTQEMNSEWMEKLADLMPEYESYGVKRGGDDGEKKNEMNAVFWLKDRFDLVETDTFWLSETPDSESKYEGAGCYRICSYAVLTDKKTGGTVIHMNTHLDNASDDARQFGAQVVMDRADALLAKYENALLILTGDFNDTVDSVPYNVISETLTESYYTNKSYAPDRKSTYTNWGNLNDEQTPIDFIFSNSSSVEYLVLDDLTNGYISDHYGVYSVFVGLN